jgi:hypothetical protein
LLTLPAREHASNTVGAGARQPAPRSRRPACRTRHISHSGHATFVGRVAQGISALGSHRTVRNSLPLHGSYHPGYTGNMVQAQWAKNRGYCLVTLCHAALALRYLLSRLYFLRIHRIR